jgi:hypothetical protein
LVPPQTQVGRVCPLSAVGVRHRQLLDGVDE